MNYISTWGEAPPVSFLEAVLSGLAPDGGLYVPEAWPKLTHAEIAAFAGRPYAEVAAKVIGRFAGDSIDPVALSDMCADAYSSFSHTAVTPLKQLSPGSFLLELFHGPTLAFKDVALQLLARLYDHALGRQKRRLTIVCATSGDTGGAAVEAFRGRANARIVVLFPEGRISAVQRRFMTTADDDNVACLAVQGTFDDCQAMLKDMFRDAQFARAVDLSGVNSINFARIAAQAVYYFVAAVALGAPERKIAFTTPTGNFGDAYAGYVAHRMGLPIERIVAATNANDIVARAFATGRYERGEVKPTSSPAMDIQAASNFERLYFDVCGCDPVETSRAFGAFAARGVVDIPPKALAAMRGLFVGTAVSEEEAARTILAVRNETGELVDPHTAVGLAAAARIGPADPRTPMVTLATAHPAKFPETVKAATSIEPPAPHNVFRMAGLPERFDTIAADIGAAKAYVREFASGMSPRVHTLSNGVRVVADPVPGFQTLALTVAAGRGARAESEAEAGWAHLLEHMVFKGAGERSARDIVEVIEQRGGSINAATGYERTSFQVRSLAGGLALGMEVVADMMLRPTLDPADLAQEVGVIAQEIAEAADTPDDLVFELAQAAAFDGQPLGRPVLGTEASIGAANPATLSAWRAQLYAPDRLVVSAAGAIDGAELLDLAERLFGAATPMAAANPAPARFTGGRAAEARKLEQAHLVFYLPGVGATDPDYFAMRIFGEALGGGMSSRLFQEAREKLGLAYAIDAFVESYDDAGLIGVYAGCAAKDAVALTDVVVRETLGLAAAIGEAELARAKAQLKASLFMGRESLSARAEQAAAQLLLFERLLEPDEIAAAIDAVTPADLARVADRFLAPKLSAPAVLGPARALKAADRFHRALFG